MNVDDDNAPDSFVVSSRRLSIPLNPRPLDPSAPSPSATRSKPGEDETDVERIHQAVAVHVRRVAVGVAGGLGVASADETRWDVTKLFLAPFPQPRQTSPTGLRAIGPTAPLHWTFR